MSRVVYLLHGQRTPNIDMFTELQAVLTTFTNYVIETYVLLMLC